VGSSSIARHPSPGCEPTDVDRQVPRQRGAGACGGDQEYRGPRARARSVAPRRL